jgi:hypothetical protein
MFKGKGTVVGFDETDGGFSCARSNRIIFELSG